MKFCFILDPLEGLKAYKDSSIAMMRCAAKRGHQTWVIQRAALTWRDGCVAARAQGAQQSAPRRLVDQRVADGDPQRQIVATRHALQQAAQGAACQRLVGG